MPIAVNSDTGAVVYLDDAGAWQPAKTAVNPQTKEMLAFDGKSWAAVPAKSKGVLGYIDDAVRAIASGVTFGFADELAAGANSLFGKGTYEENLAKERARDKQIPAAIAIPGEIAGGVGSAIAAAPVTAGVAAASGLARLPQMARFAGIGAGAGALYGAGSAEDDRMSGAATGALIGAPTGVVAPAIVRGVANAGQTIKGVFSPASNMSADLGRAITRDSDTPAAMASRLAAVRAERPGATIADVGGENIQGLVERIAQTPGAGRTTVVPALTERQRGQMGRLSNDLRDLTGTRQTAHQAVTETMAERATAAQPLYRQAYEEGEQAIWSPVLERLTSSPSVQSAMQGAVRIWRDVATADGFGGMNPGALVDRGGQLSFLNGRVPVFPNLQFWDYTKRMIDDRISAAVRAGQNQKVRTLTALNQALRDELDRAVPSYAAARDAWAGPSRYLDAIEQGRDILSPRIGAEELTATVRGLSAAEQEAFRVGAVSSIIGKMGSDSAKLGDMTKYLRSPEVRAKVAAIMPTEEAAQSWIRRLEFEVGSSELTARSMGNSATARRLAERQDADSLTRDLVMDALSGSHVKSLWQKLLTAAPQRIRDTLRSKSDARLADVLLNAQNANDLNRALSRAQQATRPLMGVTQGASAVGANALMNYGMSP